MGVRCDIVVRARGRRNKELVSVRRKPVNGAGFAAERGGPSVDDRFLGLLLGGVVITVGREGFEGLAAKGSRSSSSGKGSDPSKITSWVTTTPSFFLPAKDVISAGWPLIGMTSEIGEAMRTPLSAVGVLSEASEGE